VVNWRNASKDTESLGKRLLHYQIVEKIGEGGMGTVYKAHDSKLQRDVAVKLLSHRTAAESPTERARFEIEARAAAALNHSNIATIHAIEEVEDETFIVMEYIDGRELKDLLATGELDAERVMDIATEIAEGLRAAHDKGIVHRDIKPSNIMVTADGKIKITDFGLAKIGAGMNLTKSGTTVGTVSYMSPEQVRGEPVDRRSDIWSFGVVLYEMLTSQRPFGGDHEQAVLYSILNVEPKPVSTVSMRTSDRIGKVVSKALEKNLDARYQSIADVIADLRSIQKEALDQSQEPKSNLGKKALRRSPNRILERKRCVLGSQFYLLRASRATPIWSSLGLPWPIRSLGHSRTSRVFS